MKSKTIISAHTKQYRQAMSNLKLSEQHFVFGDYSWFAGHREIPCSKHPPWEWEHVSDLDTLKNGVFFTHAKCVINNMVRVH